MTTFFEEYKPFRNYLRHFDLLSSLEAIWHYSVAIMENTSLPQGYMVGVPQHVLKPLEHMFPWELDILSREIILNAGNGGTRSLRKFSDLATAINHIKRLDGAAYVVSNNSEPDVIFELHRIAHRQFPWQTDQGVNAAMRAFKVFGSDALDAISARELGMTAAQSLTLGMAVAGHFHRRPGMSINQDYSQFGVSVATSSAFFARISSSMTELKTQISGLQSYDGNWTYSWNPLEAKPLIRFDPEHPDRVICPIPRYLLRRALGGLFYDLVNVQGFDNSYGSSFQSYVGDVLRASRFSESFKILAETPYVVGGETFHGADWILSDATGHMFIEAKAKRLTVASRTRSDQAALKKDLDIMAAAIVQHYRNILDALDGKTQWVNDGLPVFPLILTFDDWFLFSPRVSEMLIGQVTSLLAELKMDVSVLATMPFTIASASEFEVASQIVAQVGIAKFMSQQPNQTGWSLMPRMTTNFPNELKRTKRGLFGDELNDFVRNLDPARNR